MSRFLVTSSSQALQPRQLVDVLSAGSTRTQSAATGTVDIIPTFDANVGAYGLSAYANVIHPERISVVDDPVLGARRKVMRFDVYDTDIGPTENPRAQVETAQIYGPGANVYAGYSILFPTGFPASLPANPVGNFLGLAEFYGQPFGGTSPLHLGMRAGDTAINVQRNATYGYDVPWQTSPILNNIWYDFVTHVKMSTDPAVGFYEHWVNTGAGWQQVLLNGVTKLFMQTIDSSNGSGANYHGLKLYRTVGMFNLVTAYYAEHKIGNTFAAVAPNSYA